jgi:hypothetical protein
MMTSEYREIWATPVAEYQLESPEIHQLVVDMVNQPYDVEGNKFNIMEDKDSAFTQWVFACCNEYLSKFYKKENPEIIIKRAWVTTQDYGKPNQTHSHGATDIIGVYYIHATDEHPDLAVYDPRPPHIFNEVSIWNDNGIQIADCARQIYIKPVTGKLLLIPGYLLHGVDSNLSKDPRLSLAMNIKIKRENE